MSDYLSCGSCPSEFELNEYPEFIEHKLRSCQISHSTNILECLQCFKKFHTSMPLLIHLQRDHHLAIVKMYTLPIRPELDGKGTFTDALDSMNHAGIIKVESSSSPSSSSTMSSASLSSVSHNHQQTQTWRTSMGKICTDNLNCCHNKKHHQSNTNTIASSSFSSLAPPMLTKTTTTTTATANSSSLPPATSSTSSSTTTKTKTSSSSRTTSTTSSSSSTTTTKCPCSPSHHHFSLVDSAVQTEFPLTETDNEMKFFFPTGGFVESLSEITELADLTQSYNTIQPMIQSANTSKSFWPIGLSNNNNNDDNDIDNDQDDDQEAFYTLRLFNSPIQQQQQLQQQQPTVRLNHNNNNNNPMDTTTTTTTISIMERQQQQQQQYRLMKMNDSSSSSLTQNTVAPTATTSSDPLHKIAKVLRFTCDECGRTFRQKVHLRKHILSHHIHDKPHKCNACDYATVEKSHLVVHMRKHTGEKPFHCRDCDYSSAQNCTLKNHYFRKHPLSRTACDNCGRGFVTDLEYENHSKSCLREPQYSQ